MIDNANKVQINNFRMLTATPLHHYLLSVFILVSNLLHCYYNFTHIYRICIVLQCSTKGMTVFLTVDLWTCHDMTKSHSTILYPQTKPRVTLNNPLNYLIIMSSVCVKHTLTGVSYMT